MRVPPVIIVTGVRGGGKTTLCRRIASDDAILTRGVVSTPSFDDEDRRTGIIATIHPGERRIPLAVVVDPDRTPPDGAIRMYRVATPGSGILRSGHDEGAGSFETGAIEDATDPFIGPYRFFARTFRTVNATVRHATARQTTTSTDTVDSREVTLIDEIGPLELTRRRGFYPLLDAALNDLRPLVVTTRTGLVDEVGYLVDHHRRRSIVFEIDASTAIASVAGQIVTLCVRGIGAD